MIKQAYINGFMRKCAECGVNAEQLIKYAKVEGWGATNALAYGVPAALAALVGGGSGYALTKDKKKKLRNALVTALVASGAGAALADANMSAKGVRDDMKDLVNAGKAGLLNVKLQPAQAALLLHGLGPKEE